MSFYYIDKDFLKTYIEEDQLNSIEIVIDQSSGLTNVEQAIRNRFSYVNTKLANRYEVPFQQGSDYVTDALKQNMAHLILYDLMVFYESVSDHLMETRKRNADMAEKYFNEIRDGKQDLITELNEDDEKVDRFYFSSNQRIDRDFH